eukprot:Rhum_TRINITY_DN14635_c11_g1::Rhum_TRINITY_DN14635_c11_g1_i1::g.105811::m.105811
MSYGSTSTPPQRYDDEYLPPDASGFRAKARKSPFAYSSAHLQQMKEYGMTEEEFAKEFGGRPHQQRQSPVSMTDLKRFNVPHTKWDYCSHKFIPMNLCMRAHGGYMAHRFYDPYCKHAMHEYEMCMTAEFVRQNQVLGIKKKIHLAYSNQDRNWLYNDPNWGHMLWRTKHAAYSFKAAMMIGGSSRAYDPPTHELTVENNPRYNSDIVRTDPHPTFLWHKASAASTVAFKFYWNKTAHQSAEHGTHHNAPEMVQVFDPTLSKGMQPW